MALKGGLLLAKVMHHRVRPRQNRFIYSVFTLCVPLSQLSSLKTPLCSLNRFNLFSFYERDHGAKDGSSLEGWMRGILAAQGIATADGEILLQCMPRVLGYAFNPVSFWYCLDRQGGLRAVLAEVRNTFGDSHCYFIAKTSEVGGGEVIGPDDWLKARKVFHVSPFLPVKGEYSFRFVVAEGKLGTWIDYGDEEGRLLMTSITGNRVEWNSASALKALLKMPFVTLKVVAMIHWQALKLWVKGAVFHKRPEPPQDYISRE